MYLFRSWGRRPIDDARYFNHENCVTLLEKLDVDKQ